MFWKLVEAVKGDDHDKHHASRLAARLRKLPAADIVSFDFHFQCLRAQAHRGDLWAAGVLLNHGHGTDDGFAYFRNWLISRGRKVYDVALRSADSLSRVPVHVGRNGPEAEFESFGYAAAEAYEAVTGKDIFDSREWKRQRKVADAEEFNWRSYTNEVLATKLPRLWKKYGSFMHHADADRAQMRDGYEVKEGEQVPINGLGVLSVGGSVRHKNFGVGTIKWMTKCIGSAVTAMVIFSDGERPMYISGDSDLWSIP